MSRIVHEYPNERMVGLGRILVVIETGGASELIGVKRSTFRPLLLSFCLLLGQGPNVRLAVPVALLSSLDETAKVGHTLVRLDACLIEQGLGGRVVTDRL